MQHLEVSGAVRPLKWPLGVQWLMSLHKVGGSLLINLLQGGAISSNVQMQFEETPRK